jgi:predicted phosphodiesterase
MDAPNRSRRQIVLLVLIPALIGALAGLLGQRLVPGWSHDLGPAQVSVSARMGSGDTRFVVPPLGTVSASTHVSPLSYEVSLRQVDFAEVGQAFARFETRSQLVDELESGLRGLTLATAIRLTIAGAILGAVACALLPHRRRITVLSGAAGGALALAATLGLSAATFDVDSFRQLHYTGALERAPQVLESLDRHVGTLDALRSRFSEGADRLSHLLALVSEPIPDPHHPGSVAVLHISDIHSNPVGLQIAAELATRFDVDAVIDTGDLTSFGERIEAQIGGLIEEIPVPYYFIPGNHDSVFNRRQLAEIENVTLVHRQIVNVEGIRVLGWADPTFTAAGGIMTQQGNRARELASDNVAEVVERVRPDVLAVHDARLASESHGLVPLVLAGHTHERDERETRGTTTLWVGSTGATGLGSFIHETQLDYEAQIIYFRDARAVALDYVKFRGLGGDFEVQRTTLAPTELEGAAGTPGYDAEPGRRARAAEGSALLMR